MTRIPDHRSNLLAENVGITLPTNLQKSELNLRLAGKQDVIQKTEASPVIRAQAYKVNMRRIQKDSPSVHDADLSSTTESVEDGPCDTSNSSNKWWAYPAILFFVYAFKLK